VLAAWGRGWQPRSARFDRLFLALLAASLLAAVHSHIHGLALLLVPGVFLAHHPHPRLGRLWLPIGLALPTVTFLAFLSDLPPQALALSLLLVAGLALLLAPRLWAPAESAAERGNDATGTPVQQPGGVAATRTGGLSAGGRGCGRV
jgi:hypothetical protein